MLFFLHWIIGYIIELEVWTFIRCLRLGHETMVCAVCLSIFLWPEGRIRLFAHCTSSLSSLYRLKTLNKWNACQIHFVECLSSVFLWLSRFSRLSFMQLNCYMRLCDFSLPISLMMIVRICVYSYFALSYCHHQFGNMNHSQLFRVTTWNNGMRCISCNVLIEISAVMQLNSRALISVRLKTNITLHVKTKSQVFKEIWRFQKFYCTVTRLALCT